MQIADDLDRIKLSICGVLAFPITIPLFIIGLEFNALEFILPSIWILIGVAPFTQIFNWYLVDKRHFVLTTVLFGLFPAYILTGTLYAYSNAEVYKEFIKWLEIFVVAILIFSYINSRQRFSAVYWLLFFVNIALVAKAIIFTDFSQSNILSISRIRIGHATVFSIALLLPFAIKNRSKILLYVLILVLILSQARANWIAFIIMFSLFYYQTKNKRLSYKKISISIILITCCLMLIPGIRATVHKRVSHLGVLDDKPAPSTFQRLYRIEACYYAFLDRPVLGIGAGNMFYHTKKMNKAHILEWLKSRNKKSITPHNVYAQYLAELGIIGFALFMLLLAFLYKIIACIRRDNRFKDVPHALGIYLYFAVFLVFIAFGYIAGTDRIILGIYFGLILAMLKWPILYKNCNNPELA